MERLRKVEHVVFAWAVFKLVKFVRKAGLQGLVKELLSIVIKGARTVPGLSGVVNEELGKEVAKIEAKMLGDGDVDANLELPATGMGSGEILEQARALCKRDDFETGKKWAGIYHEVASGTELEDLQCDMYKMFNNANNLYPGIFKSCRKFEAEIVQMCVEMLNGSPEACGLLTSGGTESILLAILAYREMAYERGIERPAIVCCSNAHGALDKACHYFGLDIIKVDADPQTFRLEAKQVEAALTSDTIAVYASAPSFPFGTVDPIEDIAKVTKKHNLGLHVDNCLGGFYLSGLQKAGLFDRKFDFAVDGVTTISVDIHKYGFAPKGASVVCFSEPYLRRLTVHPVTTGLTLYVTPTLQGSRGGGVVAAAWATMMYFGEEGYVSYAKRFDDLKRKVEVAVSKIPGLRLAIKSDLSIIPIASDDYDIYAVSTLLEQKGWSSFTSQNPPLMQFCVGEQHFRVIDDFLRDLEDCAAQVRKNPGIKVEGDAAVYGAAKLLPDEVLGDVMKSYIEVKMKVKRAAA
ncbi:Sphingosine-1-phosphate lyase 1 (S1PL) (SP-lyase 1) (SPL) (SPL 1) (Sphingosine-1-phosphate aldolase) [Durusdinium trenchii]|uniref:sphinganine-1-phosphate aldolase n=1 Tax=Durusdinium trenchii TaxID=1381693 RepID=A0ABP0STM5_9DINO